MFTERQKRENANQMTKKITTRKDSVWMEIRECVLIDTGNEVSDAAGELRKI